MRVYVAEVEERQSEKGSRFWRVLYVADGKRAVAYVWEPSVAAVLAPRREFEVELAQNGSRFPKIVRAEAVAADATSEPDEPAERFSERDRLISRQVALKAAAELVASWSVSPDDEAAEVIRLAERFYQWLLEV
jgi:hypothetical protein